MEVEPGGETIVEHSRNAMHERADAETDGRAEEAHQDLGVEWEMRRASIEGESWSASLRPHMRSTSQDEGHRQHTSQDDEDVPEESSPITQQTCEITEQTPEH